MSAQAILLIIGGVLLVAGVFGGGVELKEFKLPTLTGPIRVVASLLGSILVGIGAISGNTSPRDAPFPRDTALSRPGQGSDETNLEALEANIGPSVAEQCARLAGW